MSTYFVQGSTMDAIADAINAKTGGSSAMTPAQMVTAIGTISGGGISQGYEITAVDSYGMVTSVDIYGNVPVYCFGFYNNADSVGARLRSVRFMGETESIGYGAFQRTAITSITIPDSVNTIGSQAFRGNSALAHYTHENARGLYGYNGGASNSLYGFNHLETMQLGAVGKPVTALFKNAFSNIGAPSTAVFTIYCVGGNVDAFLDQMRNSLTTQTIIFKAADVTTYNGTSYVAGETMLTSEVTS